MPRYTTLEATTRDITVKDEPLVRQAWKYNGCVGKDYRKFSVVVYKDTNTCTLSIADMSEVPLHTAAFHVRPVDGEWKPNTEQIAPFTTCKDADLIEPGMAFAFKPILLKMGLSVAPDSIFAKVRNKY